MPFTLTQIFLCLFLVFALSLVILRFIGGTLSFFGLIFWSALFGSSIIAVLFPSITGVIAQSIGIGRGVDAILYASISLLFYLVFRLYIYIEDLRQEMTRLIQRLALNKENDKESSQD